ncbi:MAG: AbrB/MazE/SpoVT family DNA-binding domain-containing protein [Candidatus Eremiobacteraeota bacterium]|nr:AbrB/MazE/SpoVT family DNA-binding domain-containing protein [Candidatus Eremiobacteraeota bacterium]
MYDAVIFKAGNSLALRIPRAVARHCGLEDGASVELTVSGDVLSVRKPRARVDELIDRITPENSHPAEFQDLIGRERW